MRERAYRFRGARALDVFAHLLEPQMVRINRNASYGRATAAISSIMIVIGRDGLRRTEASRRSRACFHRFDRAIARRRDGHKRIEQMLCGVSDIIDGTIESCLVYLGRFRDSAQFSDELKRRSANLVVRRRWTKIMKCFDGSAHIRPSAIVDQRSTISRCRYF